MIPSVVLNRSHKPDHDDSPSREPSLPPRPQSLGGVDFAQVRALAPMSRVLELLHWSPVAEQGGQLRGPCPVHASSSPHSRSFSVNVEKHTFQCFKCGCRGNQLDLFASATRLPLYEAAVELCRKLGAEPPRKDRRR